jgi:transposase
LAEAYRVDSEDKMVELIFDVMELCEASNNKHLRWFENLLYNHFDGIITHATIKISAGKIEGINNKIKTLRRQAYGFPDDEYFFLKLFDMSRN